MRRLHGSREPPGEAGGGQIGGGDHHLQVRLSIEEGNKESQKKLSLKVNEYCRKKELFKRKKRKKPEEQLFRPNGLVKICWKVDFVNL